MDWNIPEMRRALATHDIATVYRQVRAAGTSQRRIAELVGQSQSEVSEILAGRAVRSYDVLSRIADGLGIPREYLGLAHVPAYGEEGSRRTEGESVKRRQFLANAAAIIVGEAVLGDPAATAAPASHVATPSRVGTGDIHRLRATAASLRQLAYRHGGAMHRAAAAAQTQAAEAMFGAAMTDEVRRDLHRAVADLHEVVGAAAFDSGMQDHSRHHRLRALEHAKQADDPAHCAFLLGRMGHMHMLNDEPEEALKLFQLAEIPASQSQLRAIDFVSLTYQARAYSEMGRADRAVDLITRSEDSFARHADDEVPHWLAYFRGGGRSSVRGHLYYALSNTRPEYAPKALEHLRAAVNEHKAEHEHGNLMDLGTLATLHLRVGNTDHGLRLAATTVHRAEQVATPYLRDRLRPLAKEAQRHGSDGRDLAVAISRL